jgi:hypothetical protein
MAAAALISQFQCMQLNAVSVKKQTALTCHCGSKADASLPNFCFCSTFCRDFAIARCSGASIAMTHRYLGGKQCWIVGEDRSRRSSKHGLETAGGGAKRGENPIDVAVRETMEEFGLHLNEKRLKEHLETAPLHLKSFITKAGKHRFYFTYVIHITGASTGSMEAAWVSRYAKYKTGQIAYDSVEMDKFFHIRLNSKGKWVDHKTDKAILICNRDYDIISSCVANYSWAVNMPSINKLKIWKTGSYIC